MVIKKEPTKSKRKHADELKVHEKTGRTAIKQHLNSDVTTLVFAIWDVLGN